MKKITTVLCIASMFTILASCNIKQKDNGISDQPRLEGIAADTTIVDSTVVQPVQLDTVKL